MQQIHSHRYFASLHSNVQQPDTQPDNFAVGVLWMLTTMCLFVTMDTVAKYLTQTYPVAQVVWARFFFHMVWLSLYLRSSLLTVVSSGNLPLQLLRSGCLMLTTLLFFTGLKTSDLSTATCIMFLSPIFVTILAVPLLGESVGLRRFIGVLVGFMGALIIVSPKLDAMASVNTSQAWTLSQLLPRPGHIILICAAMSNALYQIMTRKLSAVDSSLTALFYSGIIGAFATTAWLPTVWIGPALTDWILLACVGLLGCVSHFCLIRALRNAPASVVVPFSYSALIWATLLGFFVFSTLPDRSTLLGAALIIASGLYIFYREKQLKERTTSS